jgi:crossover junction endodeoxyribonuclease RuvC
MRVIGIDPGKDGAVVVLDGSNVLSAKLTADLLLAVKAGKAPDYAPGMMWAHLTEVVSQHRPELAVLELPGGRPGEGAGSARVTGVGWGLWRMALAAAGVPTIVPASAKWTRTVLQDAPGEGKARAVHVALSRVPGLNLTPGRRKKPHDGLADACCLALYGQLRGLE